MSINEYFKRLKYKRQLKAALKVSRMFPILTAPEGLDIWNEKDEHVNELRKSQEEIVRNIALGKMHGVLLPFGWKLKLVSYTEQLLPD
jgi:hypothetical protein